MATLAQTPSNAGDPLYPELWRACAGPLVTVPRVGDLVSYFPQGHIEQGLSGGDVHEPGRWEPDVPLRLAVNLSSGQPKRHLLQSGWSVFVSSKRLVAGDAFIFLRGENGELRVGVRRAMRQLSNVPSLDLSSQSMHVGVLATAWHVINTKSMFTVYYNPRTSPSEFIIPYDQYTESVKNYSIGMRFRMRFEGEEAPEHF